AGMRHRQRLKNMLGHVVLKHLPGGALDNVSAETHAVIRIGGYFTGRKHSPRLVLDKEFPQGRRFLWIGEGEVAYVLYEACVWVMRLRSVTGLPKAGAI